MKRRTFVKATGLVAVGTTVNPGEVITDLLPKKKPFTIILGSGMAGLGAARKLKEAGYDYLILEARNRTGGRVFSHSMDGLTCELGAEWIGKNHVEIQNLNREFSTEMLDHSFETRLLKDNTFHEAGAWGFDDSLDKWKAALKYVRDNETDTKLLTPIDKIDYWRYLHQIGVSEENIELRDLLDSTDFGECIRGVSAFSALSEYAFSSEKNEMDFITKGGNSTMVQGLTNLVGEEKIKLNHTVTEVSQVKKKIRVTCANGAVFEADRLICTLPTFAVMKIKWSPLFNSAKRDAMDQLSYCRIIKNSMVFSERFWKDESFDMITDTLGHYFFHSTKLQPGKNGILTSYATGDRAYVLSKMSKEKRMKELAACLEPVFGNVKPLMTDMVGYYWGADQHVQGAYAIFDTTQWFGQRSALIESSGNIFFAGEHLADWQGFMEGAYVSGVDAASSVIRS